MTQKTMVVILRLKKKKKRGVPVVVQQKQIQLGTMRFWVQSQASLSRLKIRRCCELWQRAQTRLGSSVTVAVVQWCRSAAVALIRPLAQQPLYATGVALKRKKKKKRHKIKSQRQAVYQGCCNEIPHIEWLKQQKCIGLQFGRLEVQNQGFGVPILAQQK